MKIAIGCDHAAVDARTLAISTVERLGHSVIAITGPKTSSEKYDYPDAAHEVVVALRGLTSDNTLPDPTEAVGIVVCGSGIGICMAANKHSGVRCALCHDHYSAKMCRAHNNANILAMGARTTGPDIIVEMIETFLSTPFEGGRHQGRLDKIMSYQNA
ncbi:hypothetical protein GEMRC1_006323 [Eukaryota sp. GEM-RC1]